MRGFAITALVLSAWSSIPVSSGNLRPGAAAGGGLQPEERDPGRERCCWSCSVPLFSGPAGTSAQPRKACAIQDIQWCSWEQGQTPSGTELAPGWLHSILGDVEGGCVPHLPSCAGADGWSPPCPQQQQGRPQGHKLGCPHVAQGSVPREELAPLMSLLSPATRRAQPPRRHQGLPKKSQQKPPRRRSDLARGLCPVLLGWGPSRPSASDRRRNNCARASCCVCRSSHPGGVSMYAGF